MSKKLWGSGLAAQIKLWALGGKSKCLITRRETVNSDRGSEHTEPRALEEMGALEE